MSDSGTAPAAEVRLEAAADRASVTIGDPVILTVRLTYPKGTRVDAFVPERALADLTVLDRTVAPPKTLEDGRIEESRVLRLAAYRVGPVEIPALEVAYVDAQGKEGKAASAPITLQIVSVLAPGETRPADIKPQARMPERAPWLFALLGLTALLLAAWAYWRRRARRTEGAVAVPAAPPRPPHEIAYAELERLLSSGWLEAGRIKELYIELAEIIKRYLTGRFGVVTFERTTTEILEALRLARVPVKATADAFEFFSACDLVKFAKHLPATEETRGAVEMAYRLVDETRPAVPAASPEAGAQAAPAAAGGARP